MKLGLDDPSCHTWGEEGGREIFFNPPRGILMIGGDPHYFDCSVQRGTSELVVIFGVDNNHHDVMGMSLKYLTTLPLLVPIPELYGHVI